MRIPRPQYWILAIAATACGLVWAGAVNGAWLARARFLTAAWDGWPRPVSATTAPTLAGFASQHPLIGNVAWGLTLVLAIWLVRALSADLPFVLAGSSATTKAGDWLKVWVDPRLSARGIIASLASLWLLGLPLLWAGEAYASTPTRRVLLGGPTVLIAQALGERRFLVHGLVSVGLMTAVFVLWSSNGFFTNRAVRLSALLRTAAQGALTGCALAVVWLPFVPLGQSALRWYLRGSGPLAAETTRQVMLLTTAAAVLGAYAITLIMLGAGKTAKPRWVSVVGWLLVGLLALGEAAFHRFALVQRLDLNRTLKAAAGLTEDKSSERRMAILINNRPRCPSARVRFRTLLGLEAGPEGVRKTEDFLRQRKRRTLLYHEAFAQLFDSAALQLDRTRLMRLCLDHPVVPPRVGRFQPLAAPLLREMLPDVMNTPANRALLTELCDPRRLNLQRAYFMHAPLGEAWWRLGDATRAREFFVLAGLRRRRLEAKLAQPMVRDGRVRGELVVNGKPAPSVQVGLVYTPRWLELNGTANAPPNAFSLRTVCAATRTDARGRFELPGIVSGEYFLVLIFPPEVVRPEFEVEVMNQPGLISIGPERERNLRAIRVRPVPALPARGREEAA